MVVTAAALVLLRRKRNQIVSLYRTSGAVATATALGSGLVPAIERSRLKARAAGIDRVSAELGSLGESRFGFDIDGAALALDAARAEVAAASYAEQWLAAADKEAVRSASSATDYALARTATTEAAQAFNEERLASLRELPEAETLAFGRRWDAQLDACPICWGEDGTTVGVHEDFPLGEPGAVHPRCLCSWTLVAIH